MQKGNVIKMFARMGGILGVVCMLAFPQTVKAETEYKLTGTVLEISGDEEIRDMGLDLEIDEKKAEIETVFIRNGVTAIGSRAFEGFKGLKNLILPTSVKKIETGAFADCEQVEITLEVNHDTHLAKNYYSVLETEGYETRVSIPENASVTGIYYVKGTLLNNTGEDLKDIVVEKNGVHATFDLSAGGQAAYSEEEGVMTGNVICREHFCFHSQQHEATCGKSGVKEYYRCLVCAAVFSDAAMTTEITDYDELYIPATGEHKWDYGKLEKAPTATETGTEKYVCMVCGASYENTVPALGPEKAGKVLTVNGARYTVLSSEKAEVAFSGVVNKKTKSVVIPAKITVDGISYKVTAISAKALKGNGTVSSITVGTNVASIGKKAFWGCTGLKNIVLKTSKLSKKSVGNAAFKKIGKKTVIKVPAKKKKAYKAILRAKGAGEKVKIK